MARKGWILGLSVAAAVAFAPLGFAGEPARHFVAAWAISQQGLGQAMISNATVRMIARVTVPGDQVRIRLDNTFGKAPLVIGRAMLGPRIRGAEIARGMNMLVTFNGGQSVTIPPGGSAVSDPVGLRVDAQQDLAVSLYVSGADVQPSQHNNAFVTSYVTDNNTGDQTTSETGQPFTNRVTAMYWLKAIDVRANAAVSSIVAFGDSITDGTCSTLDANDRWEDIVATRFALQRPPRRAIVNEGIGGNTVTNAGNYNPVINSPAGVDRLERDVLSHPGVSHVVLFMGTNDIVRGAPASLVQNGIKDIVSRVHAKGLKIVGATIIPRANATWSDAKTKIKNEVNAWMKKDAGFDAILDFDRVVKDPKNPALIRADYDCGDAIHPSPIGYFRMGRAVDLSVFAK
jgi:lysophospholipase L1-like esterase